MRSMAIAALCLVCQLLGAASLFQTLPVVVACALTGSAAVVVAHRRAPSPSMLPRAEEEGVPPAPRVSRAEMTVAALSITLVAAMWSTWLARAFSRGIENRDSLWYHLPIAARFAQEGQVTDPHS